MYNIYELNNLFSRFESGKNYIINVTIGPDPIKFSSDIQDWDNQNSIAHEMRHVSDAILDYYGDEWEGSETPAYLDGYIFQKVVETIAQPCY